MYDYINSCFAHTYTSTDTHTHTPTHTHSHTLTYTHRHRHTGFPGATASHPIKQYKSLILVISINSKVLKIFLPFFSSSHYPRYSSGSLFTHLLPKYTKLAAYQLIFLHDPLKILCVCAQALMQRPSLLLPLEKA